MGITDYSLSQAKGYEGQVATAEPTRIRSYGNGGAVGIAPGRIVVQATNDSEAVLPSATGQKVAGVTVLSNIYEKDDTGTFLYPVDKAMDVLVDGVVYMLTETAVTKGSPVYFRHTANASPATYEAVGRVRANANTDKADLIDGAKFLESGAAGDLVQVAFDLV